MKKNLLFLILVISLPAFSQNWAPINTTEKFCYSTDDTIDIINNVLWVESFEQNGDEQVYQLNKIARPVEDEDFQYLYNEPQFLLDQITILENGEWICLDTFFTPLDTLQEFSLFPNAGLNVSWDFTDELQAEVTEMGVQEILGESDSIKTIALSDNSEIILSKEHGIINWRNQYQLIGIEGRDLGVLVPDFEDMYANVTEGDVACIYKEHWQADETVVGWYEKRRIEIESVEKYQDSIVIVGNVFSLFYQWWKSPEIIELTSQTLVFHRSRSTDIYPNDTLLIDNINSNVDGSVVISKLDYHDWGGLKKSQIVYNIENYGESTCFYFCSGLFSYELCSFSMFPEYLLLEHSVNFGFQEFYDSGFEWGNSDRLVGYIDEGIEYGEIYPRDMFVGTNQLTLNSNWLVYPNPAKDQIFLHSSQTGSINYQIFNYSGILIDEQTINKTDKEVAISVDEFPSGVYLVKLIQNDQTEVLKFLKK